METTIVIDKIETLKSGGKKLITTDGNEFLIGAKNVQTIAGGQGYLATGQEYICNFAEIESEFKGKKQKTAWANKLTLKSFATPTKTSAPASSTTNGNGHSKYSEADVDAFKRKDVLIVRQTAEKCAAECVRAYAELIRSAKLAENLTEPEIRNWIDSYRKTVYETIVKEVNA